MMNNTDSVKEVEVVLEDLKTMNQIATWPGVEILTFIKCNIEKIDVSHTQSSIILKRD